MKMNKENILKEGILESYFLGDLSREQEQEVFEIVQSDAELKRQFNELEQSMEKLAFENAVTPPAHIKEDLLKIIGGGTQTAEQSKVRELNTSSYKRYFRVAASVAILFMTSSLVLWMNLNTTNQELTARLNEQEVLLDSLSKVTKGALKNEELMAFVNNPETERHLLKGNKIAPEASVLSYVNHAEKSVLVHVHKLPKIDGKDYQMWADVDGEMIDMGVLDASKELLTMNYIENAESINITIEEEGGSDHPDVSNLIGSVTL
ncbi:MAG: hypothetical protein CMB99_01975 [Flavobacteriaceae bacterium]|nr:hypothetical protein [Flavobacteriaceae bacterium]|tara:strand:+ start:41276 stop:42064 length:789 start_codon:yes stop_codon:yes gene_type:complete